ncbi:MAG: chitobiase/beta-hexosaminidase C-terminal domain-containing protein [Paludibacteraceae bacterium]|nr:chitobiase/beta-hexosaminidase C-terminal domain-containing protein [Paludibacteraceae bacterium]
MKHVKLFVALFAMLALGVGNAWAEEYTIGWGSASGTNSQNFTAVSGEVSGVLSFTSAKNSSSSDPAYNSNNQELRLYYNAQGNGGSITLTPASGVTITGAVITTSTTPSVKYTVDGGTATSVSQTSKVYTISGISATNSLKIQNVNTSNTQLRIKTIKVTYEVSSSSTILTDAQFAWSAQTAEATMPSTFEDQPTLTNTLGLDVSYSSSTPAVATINATSGAIDLVGAGTTTISATFAGGEIGGTTYAAKTVSYTLTVKPAPLVIEPIEGGIIDILTHNTLAATSSSYVEFTNKQAANENHSDAVYAGRSSRNGNATQYSIQLNSIDKGRIATTTSGGLAKRVYVRWATQGTLNTNNRSLYIYGSNDAFTGNETSTSATKIGTITFTTGAAEAYVDLEGDYKHILITGSGAIYMDEIQVTWVADDTPEVPTLDAPTFDLEEGTYNEEQEVTLSAEEGTIYYTLDGTTPDAESIEYTDPIVLNECGEITIKAIAISGEITSSVASATYTIKLPLNNSQANPYTEADAIEVYDGGCYDNQDVYVMGVVKTAQFYNSNTYTITLEGGFQFYKFYEAAGEVTFTEDYIVAGDTLVACGKLVKYEETYELGAGCYLVEYKPYSLPKVDISNTKETAYTVEEAIALIDNITSDLTKQVYVKGTVSEIVTEYDAEYGNITYNISSDGSTSSPQFQLYRGKSYDGEKFTSADDIKVGDKVVVYGEMKKHNSTYEMNAGNQLVALEREDTTTALDNVEATVTPVKAIVNGQLIIIKNGVQYNAQGQVIK